MMIENQFNIGDIVYLKTDEDQREHIVIGIEIVPNDLVYKLASGADVTQHYSFEIITEKAESWTKGK